MFAKAFEASQRWWHALGFDLVQKEDIVDATLVTMKLDCAGYDPDAVLEKLQKTTGKLWVTEGGTDVQNIQGWPEKYERIKGGILVSWQPLTTSRFYSSMPVISDAYHLAIGGKKSGAWFVIHFLSLHAGAL